ncbi:Alpha/beta hydrolase family-domain-containing protein [Lentinula aciculospora]|uniref:Alpha/beta hydrolase family-domain-containing protein n=1 Tax=Lentinula aciculospora TaxID=153920 RepID=A0A9W9AKE5_9AGAR|nr:Alpha/beta hydrolase family-domain-containing protein [Lentinula aciculospora]
MVALEVSSLTFETHTTGLSLLNSAKCYRPSRVGSTRDPQVNQGLVLMMAHGTGYHKEHWEPTIEHLFDYESEQQVAKIPPTLTIRECWAIDVQNHGEAAVLNEQVTREIPDAWSIWDYADAFVTLRRDILGSNPSYRNNKFVLVAHSASATAAILTTTFFPLPVLQSQAIFHSLILIEPAIAPNPAFIDPARHTPLYRSISRLIAKRKDTWTSKEEARAWMAEKMPWGMWDERVLKVYVEFGLGYAADKGVTLRCTRRTEALAYERGIRQSLPGLWQLNLLCSANAHVGDKTATSKSTSESESGRTASKPVGSHKPIIPIHIVWGEVDDLFSREIKDGLEDPEQGRVFTSVRRVEDVGHMMVQTSPQATAKVLWDIFRESSASGALSGDDFEDSHLKTQKPEGRDGAQRRSRL